MDKQSLHQWDIRDLMGPVDHTARKTRIVWTLGPSWGTVERLWEMLDAGMNIARLNFSHGTHKTHERMVEKLREAK